MNKMIFGFIGQMASGKGTAVEYLKTKYSASTYRFSSILKDILERLYLDLNRENYHTISQIIRQNFGEDIMSSVMVSDIEKDNNNLIAIDGVRRPDDVVKLKKMPGFMLVYIFSDIEKRYERITKRTEKADDQTKTLEEFKKDHEGEPESKIEEIAREAKETIDNNGTVEELHMQLDVLVQKYIQN